MEIKKTIILRLEKDKNNFICYDSNTVQMILGTKAVSGNYHFYNIQKDGGKYIIPVKVVKERVVLLERRKQELDDRLNIMKQILK